MNGDNTHTHHDASDLLKRTQEYLPEGMPKDISPEDVKAAIASMAPGKAKGGRG